jgi:hypothetical protein
MARPTIKPSTMPRNVLPVCFDARKARPLAGCFDVLRGEGRLGFAII